MMPDILKDWELELLFKNEQERKTVVGIQAQWAEYAESLYKRVLDLEAELAVVCPHKTIESVLSPSEYEGSISLYKCVSCGVYKEVR